MQPSHLIAALVLPLALASMPAEAGSFTSRRGNTASWQGSRTGNTAAGSVTGPAGRTVSGSVSGYNSGGVVQGYRGSITGPNGNTVNAGGTYLPGVGGAVEAPGHGGAVIVPGTGAAVWAQPPHR